MAPTDPKEGSKTMAYMRTALLLAALTGLFLAAGFLIGGRQGMVLAFVIACAMNLFAYWNADKLVLRMYGARPVDRASAPEFHDLVAELAARAQLPMPKVYIIENAQPNAFATGRNPNNAVVCATQGLLRSMPADEVEAVMAHELMHVKHRDILISSVAAAVATAISAIANMAMFAGMFGGGREDEDRPNPLVVMLAAIVAPIAAGLMQMAISRSREFEADRGAAELLGTGRPLANALQRIEGLAAQRPMAVAPAQAQAYIHNPLNELRRGSGAGHPQKDADRKRA